MADEITLDDDSLEWVQDVAPSMLEYMVNNHLLKKCESPIEQKMLVALLVVFFEEIIVLGTWAILGDAKAFQKVAIEVQPRIGKYRADFKLNLIHGHKGIVIECDGHDFHERTKQQAAYDRSRDRWMTAQGYTVLRFTGSEIWRDALSCAAQVRNFVRESNKAGLK